MTMEGKLLGRAEIFGIIQLDTGLHIGKSKDTLEIGGIDNPIIRDPFSRQPYIPGSSLKGKMRSFAEKVQIAAGNSEYDFDSWSQVSGATLYRHECPTAEVAVKCPVCRLFGANGSEEVLGRYKKRNPNFTGGSPPKNFPARLTVWDAFLTKKSAERDKGVSELPYAEWKSENTVDRITAAANPRQVERAAKGLEFEFHLTYAIKPDYENIVSDLQNLLFAMWLVEANGLGGQTSRGSGKIAFGNLSLQFSQYSLDTSGKIARFYREPVDALTFPSKGAEKSDRTLDALEDLLHDEAYQSKVKAAYFKQAGG